MEKKNLTKFKSGIIALRKTKKFMPFYIKKDDYLSQRKKLIWNKDKSKEESIEYSKKISMSNLFIKDKLLLLNKKKQNINNKPIQKLFLKDIIKNNKDLLNINNNKNNSQITFKTSFGKIQPTKKYSKNINSRNRLINYNLDITTFPSNSLNNFKTKEKENESNTLNYLYKKYKNRFNNQTNQIKDIKLFNINQSKTFHKINKIKSTNDLNYNIKTNNKKYLNLKNYNKKLERELIKRKINSHNFKKMTRNKRYTKLEDSYASFQSSNGGNKKEYNIINKTIDSNNLIKKNNIFKLNKLKEDKNSKVNQIKKINSTALINSKNNNLLKDFKYEYSSSLNSKKILKINKNKKKNNLKEIFNYNNLAINKINKNNKSNYTIIKSHKLIKKPILKDSINITISNTINNITNINNNLNYKNNFVLFSDSIKYKNDNKTNNRTKNNERKKIMKEEKKSNKNINSNSNFSKIKNSIKTQNNIVNDNKKNKSMSTKNNKGKISKSKLSNYYRFFHLLKKNHSKNQNQNKNSKSKRKNMEKVFHEENIKIIRDKRKKKKINMQLNTNIKIKGIKTIYSDFYSVKEKQIILFKTPRTRFPLPFIILKYVKVIDRFNRTEEKINLFQRKKKKEEIIEKKIFYVNLKKNLQYPLEYINEILQNLFIEEDKYLCNTHLEYLNHNYKYYINPDNWQYLMNSLINIQRLIVFSENTLFLTIQIFSKYIYEILYNNENKKIIENNLDIYLIASLIIAAKNEEIKLYKMKDYMTLLPDYYLFKDLINIEKKILYKLNFNLIIPTSLNFFELFSVLFKVDSKQRYKGLYLLNIILMDYNLIKIPPSILALCIIKIITKNNIKNEILKRIIWKYKNGKKIELIKVLNIIKDDNIINSICQHLQYFEKIIKLSNYDAIIIKFDEFNK